MCVCPPPLQSTPSTQDGKLDATINERKIKAFSYLSEIRALLSDMPFGKRRLENWIDAQRCNVCQWGAM